MSKTWLRRFRWFRRSAATGLPSCDPTVSDLERLADPLECRGVETTFWGDKGSGGGTPRAALTGEAAMVVAAF
jgi:hypothetical protein